MVWRAVAALLEVGTRRSCLMRVSSLSFIVLSMLVRTSANNIDLDFTLPSDEPKGFTADVVTGGIWIRGLTNDVKFLNDIGYSVRNALGTVCKTKVPVIGTLVQDVQTFDEIPYTVKMAWWVMPNKEMGPAEECVFAFFPFTEDASLLLKLIAPNVANNRQTQNIDTSGWVTILAAPSIYAYNILYPARLPEPLGAVKQKPEPTVEPNSVPDAEAGVTLPPVPAECLEGAKVSQEDKVLDGCDRIHTTPPASFHRRRQMASLLPRCTSMQTACACATVGTCKWGLTPSGGFSCNASMSGFVTCDQCAAQSNCESPAELCAMQTTPCSCVGSRGDCRWDEDANECVERKGGSTPCSACTRQDHCTPPYVVRSEPSFGTSLDATPVVSGKKRYIRLIFNRKMQLGYNKHFGMMFRCQGWDLVRLPGTLLTIDGHALVIEAAGIPNEIRRKCQMEIIEATVADMDGFLYLGMLPGEDEKKCKVTDKNGNYALICFTFWLEDTDGPRITGFNPPNSAVDIHLDATPIIKFHEGLVAGSGFKVELVALGQGTAPKADWFAKESSATTESRVDTDGAAHTQQHFRDKYGDDWQSYWNQAPPYQSQQDLAVGQDIYYADKIITTYFLGDVALGRDTLTVFLQGHVKSNLYYSLRIPRGALTDLSENNFSGIGTGDYVFRTTDVSQEQDLDDSISTEVIVFIICATVLFCALLCFTCGLCIYGGRAHEDLAVVGENVMDVKNEDADAVFNNRDPQSILYDLRSTATADEMEQGAALFRTASFRAFPSADIPKTPLSRTGSFRHFPSGNPPKKDSEGNGRGSFPSADNIIVRNVGGEVVSANAMTLKLAWGGKPEQLD